MNTANSFPIWKRFTPGSIKLELLKEAESGTHEQYEEYKKLIEKNIETNYVIGNIDGYTTHGKQLYEPNVSLSSIDIKKGIVPTPHLFSLMKIDALGRGKFHSMDDVFLSIDKANAKGFFVNIKEKIDKPIAEFVTLTKKSNLIIHHDVIVLEPQTSVTFLRVIDGVEDSLIADNVEIFANPGSFINCVTINKTKKNGFYASIKRAQLSRGAKVNWFNIDMGESNTALSIRSLLVEQEAESKMIGVIVGKKDAQKDMSYETFHSAPDTTTSVVVRAAVLDYSKVVYRALTHIASGSKRAKVEQAEKSIMIGDHAKFDGIPSLWIDEDDVIASHSASSGKVDEQTMFYLKSRGIPHQVAEKIITEGFISSILNTFPVNLVGNLLGY